MYNFIFENKHPKGSIHKSLDYDNTFSNMFILMCVFFLGFYFDLY